MDGATGASGAPLTILLHRWRDGDEKAFDELVPLIYNELRAIARTVLARERGGNTLGCTALVNESYLRLMGPTATDWEGRSQFFGAAARAMRRVLVDHARARKAIKRGEGAVNSEWDEVAASVAPNVDLVVLDQALGELALFDAELARLVELRYFGGLSIEETAAMMGSSPAGVKRKWTAARAWLYRRMTGNALD
ncbi:MAG: RNA polymerase subunit sigma-70 [Bryobacterales bacterium]|nr:RNA polymerase subunit sigma-70 [Bryobacterales bacterium]